MITPNQRFAGILVMVALLLLVPFVAMRFTGEVKWSGFDFVVAGVLLLGTGLLVELALRLVKETRYRLIAVGVILFLAFIAWAELAVGLIGTPLAGS